MFSYVSAFLRFFKTMSIIFRVIVTCFVGQDITSYCV